MRLFSASVVLFLGLMPVSGTLAADCDNAQDQATMTMCADQSYRKSDAELNALYKQVTGRLKGQADTSKRLVSAQKAWVAFRDAECGFATSASRDGSIYPMVAASCRDGLTQKRIDDLKAYLKCDETDPACPVPAQ